MENKEEILYVGDIVSANRLAMTSEDVEGEVINIGSGKIFL